MTDSPKGERDKPRPLPSRDELRQKTAQRRVEIAAWKAQAQPIMSLEDAHKLASLAGRTDAAAVRDLCDWINEEGPILRASDKIPAAQKSADMAARGLLGPLGDALQLLLTVLAPTKREAQDEKAVRVILRRDEVIGRIEDAYPRGAIEEIGRDQCREDIEGLSRLREAVREALKRISVKRGRSALEAMHTAAELLARKYEELSRKPYTFDSYKGGWQTPGTEFVARGLHAIFPGATDANLRSVMRDKTLPNSNLQK